MKPPGPEQRIRRWQTYLAVWGLHRWLGLGTGLFIVVASLTGALLVLHHDLERWLHPERHVVPAPPPEAPPGPGLADIVRAVAPLAPPGYRPLRIEPGHGATDAYKLVFIGADSSIRWSAFFDPHTGQVLWHGADQHLLTPWLLHLHMHLHAGTVGYVAMGVASLALTLLALTGVWITRGRLALLLRRPLRLGRGWRIAASDLHKWTGLVSLYFSFILGATGLWFSILIIPDELRRQAPEPLAPAFDLTQLAPIEPALATVRAQWPGAELARIILPWDDGVGLQVRVLHREAPVWRKLSRIDFDPATGAIRRIRDARDAAWTDQLQSILGPLHFGYYGSTLVKWLYVAGGLAPTVLCVSGTIIWWCRRRSAGQTRI